MTARPGLGASFAQKPLLPKMQSIKKVKIMKKTSIATRQNCAAALKQKSFKFRHHRNQLSRPGPHTRSRITGRSKSARQWWLPASHINRIGRGPCRDLAATGIGRAPMSSLSEIGVPTQVSALEPLEALMAIEDIWLRLLAHFQVKLSCQQGNYELIFVGLKTAALDGHVSQPLLMVADLSTYVWHVQEHRGQFIECIEYQGSDLILQVQSMSHIQRWPAGEELACQVESFMLRLQGLVNRNAMNKLTNREGSSI